jgi:hypothetical protein
MNKQLSPIFFEKLLVNHQFSKVSNWFLHSRVKWIKTLVFCTSDLYFAFNVKIWKFTVYHAPLSFFFFFFFCGNLVLVSWQAFHYILMKLDFISQPSSKSTLPFCRITAYATMPGYIRLNFCFHALILMNGAWNMVSKVGSGFEPRTFQSWIFCLNL